MLNRLRELYRHRTLVAVLTSRELKARYRGSALGFLWSLLNPLLMLTVYTLVFRLLLPNRSAETQPYALFLFSGLLPWTWLAASLTDAAASLLTNGALLKKILFPAEVLPIVAVLAQAAHFVLALPVLFAGLVVGRAGLLGPGGEGVRFGAPVLQVPLLLALQALLLAGVGLFLAALTVHFRDVKDVLATLLALGFFATPILYALPDVAGSRFGRLLSWNPLAPLFGAWRKALLRAEWVEPSTWAVVSLVAVGSFGLGYLFFDRLRDSFPEAV